MLKILMFSVITIVYSVQYLFYLRHLLPNCLSTINSRNVFFIRVSIIKSTTFLKEVFKYIQSVNIGTMDNFTKILSKIFTQDVSSIFYNVKMSLSNIFDFFSSLKQSLLHCPNVYM